VKEGVAQAERRLTRLRRLAAAVPAREQIDSGSAPNWPAARRPDNAETAPQAQPTPADRSSRGRRTIAAARYQGSEFSPVQPFGDAYGE